MMFNEKIYNLQSLKILNSTKLKICVLGGSFDPAHNGHLSVTRDVLNKYKFDLAIWLVARQNPLKEDYKTSFEDRCLGALKLADKDKRIIVTSLENELNSSFSLDVMRYLKNHYKYCNFTWLMGIDNISNFGNWYRSELIVRDFNIIINDRPCEGRLAIGQLFVEKCKAIVARSGFDPIMNSIRIERSKLYDISSTEIRLAQAIN